MQFLNSLKYRKEVRKWHTDMEEDLVLEALLLHGHISAVVEAGCRAAGIPDYGAELLLMPLLG